MIPELEELRRAYVLLARRHGGRTPFASDFAARLLAEAEQLATEPRDEPAALFFALCRAWFPGEGWTIFPDMIAANHARNLGMELRCQPGELRALREDIAVKWADYDEVREWFAEHLST